jgi:DNA-binding transcriptional LysR family regulator
MLNLDQVVTYLTILQAGSFHEAARRLGISQASVSQQIRKLEQAVGATLIVRATCSPAPNTEDFLRYAKALVDLAERTATTFSNPVIAVGAASNIGTYLLPDLLKRFKDDNTAEPRVTIDNNRAVADLLTTDTVDVALMEWWDDRPGFEARVWREEELVVIVGPEHPWRDRRRVRLEDLEDQPVFGGEPFTGTGTLLRKHESSLSTINLGSTEAVKQAVRSGLGVSLVIAGAVRDEVEHGTLHSIPVTGTPLRKELFVVHRPNPLPGGPVAAFAELVLARCE